MKLQCFRIFKNKVEKRHLISDNKEFNLQLKRKKMKAVTIPQIDEAVYSAIKERAAENKLSVSQLVNEIMSEYLEGKSESNEDELEALRSERQQLEDALRAEQEQRATLEKEVREHQGRLTHLADEKQKWQDHYYEAKNANEQLTAMRKNTVMVELSELEYRLINLVSEKESRKHSKEITPALLLKTMFVNYSIHGEMWFFDHPKRSEIKAIQQEIEAENKTE